MSVEQKEASNRLFIFILFAMVLAGALTGLLCNAFVSPKDLTYFQSGFGLLSRLFLRLIQMIIAPLVLSTLVAGIARMGSGARVGGVAIKAFALFICWSFVALGVGAAAALALRPGSGLHLQPDGAAAGGHLGGQSLSNFFEHVVPTSIFDALSSNAVLQIVVFSLFAGLALAKMGEQGRALTDILDQISRLTLIMAQYVMRLAPVGVFAATAAVFSVNGLGLIRIYAAFIGEFYVLLALISLVLMLSGFLFLGGRTTVLMDFVREPAILAFSTGSSEAAYPKLLLALESFGVPPTIAGFILPLGYAFNLVGSMVYCSFATLFLAQAFNVPLSWGEISIMLLMLLVMSKGIANVPRASLVVIAAVLPYFQIPDAGIALILGIDQVLDMGRTGLNVIANAIAASLIAQWEGVLATPLQGGVAEILQTTSD